MWREEWQRHGRGGVISDKKVPTKMKVLINQTAVRPTLFYVCKTWPMSAKAEKRIATTEMGNGREPTGTLEKLELRPILPAVTPLALLWLAFPAVSDTPRPSDQWQGSTRAARERPLAGRMTFTQSLISCILTISVPCLWRACEH